MQETVVVLFDADQVAAGAEELDLYAIGNELRAAFVAVWVGQRALAGGIVRSADIAESAEPLVRALALPAKAAKLGLAVLAKINLAKGTIEGHLAVATLGDRVVGETILAIVEEGPPEDAHGRPEEGHRPHRRSDEEEENQNLLHQATLYIQTCRALIYGSS